MAQISYFKNRAKQRLLSKYSSDEYGYWKVTGEPFGGNLSGVSDRIPLLGFFEGSYIKPFVITVNFYKKTGTATT